MKNPLPISTHRTINLIIVAIITFGTITAHMQQSGAPRLAKPDIPAALDVEMTFVEGPERTANRETGPPSETRSPQTIGAFARNAQPKTFGVCDTAGPIEVEASGGVVGPTAYATLGAAFTAINAGTHTGTITIDVAADTVEAATAVLNASGAGSASYTSIAISPCGGAARTITGALALPLIDLNGADNVTIDGLNTGGNSLTISNTNSGAVANTSTIRFIGGATNNLITRCSIQGSFSGTVATAGGTIYFSTDTVALTGNDNNTVSNCNIGPAGANLPSKAIYASGTTTTLANENSGVLIDNNNIFDFFRDVNASGIHVLSGNDNWTISNNRLYQTAARAFTTAASRYAGITLNSSSGTIGAFTVTGNTIGFGAANGTGTTTITGSSNEFRGFDFPSVNTTTPTSVQGNTISGISQTSSRASTSATSSCFVGIMLGTSAGRFNVGDVTGNTIGSLDASSSIVINETSTTANTAPAIGIYDFSLSGNNTSNNKIGTITINSGGTGTTVGFRGILSNTSSSVTATINNNIIGGTAAGSITDNIVGSYAMYGIQTALPTLSMTGNLIRNFSGNANGAVVTMSGLALSSSAGASLISQNTVHSLSNTVTGGSAGAVYAIDLTLPVTANIVERNLVHSISVTSTLTAYQIYGIIARTLGTATYKNNMIRIGLDAAGGSITTGFSIVGIRDSAGATSANNYYHNSVYVGGAGVVSASNTYCLLSDVVTNTRNFQDNIFWNARSNASGGIANIVIRVGGTAPNPAGLTSDYNDLYFSGTDGVTGFFNALIVPTLAAWRTATGQDNNSFAFDPQFIAPNGTAATGDLHIHPTNPTPIESAGILIASVTNDFDGQTRSTLTPVDIGADAGNFVGLDISPPGISYTPLANTGSTSNRTLSATITDATGVASGSLLPRIYFKKSTDGAYVSTQSTMSGGTPQNGTYNCLIDYTLVGGGTVMAGDTIQYFVVAQDTLGNLSSNPGAGFAGTDVNTVTTPPTTPNSYTIVATFAGSVNVGTTETITSLTNAAGLFAQLNAGTTSGNLTINITSDLTSELGTNALNQQIEEGGGAGTYTITIKPSGGVRTVSGAAVTSLIRLDGADRVTIDGSQSGGTDKSLIISNTSTTGAVVHLLNSATNNTVKNADLRGVSTSTSNGVVFISTTGSGVVGNNTNTFQSNDIHAGATAPAYGVYDLGSGTAKNTNDVITQNRIFDFQNTGIRDDGNSANATYSQNEIFEMTAQTTSLTGFRPSATSIDGFTFTRNYIHDLNTSSTGTVYGIQLFDTNGTAAVPVISNNMISLSAAAPLTLYGLYDLTSSSENYNVAFNSIYLAGAVSGASSSASYNRAIASVTSLRDNILVNARTGGTGFHYAIKTTTPLTSLTSNFNDIYNTGGTGNIFGNDGTADRANLAAWQAATSLDTNSISADPLFISATDLHLNASGANPALSAGNGTGTGVTTDFDNDPRPASNPDIGADEVVQAVAGVIPSGTFYNALTADGDSLGGNVSITNIIYLNGKLSTGANTLAIGCNATVSGGGASNYVIGNLKKTYCAAGSKNFEVGTANGFSPVTVNVTAGTFPADFTTKAVQGPQPNLAVPAKALQRYWTLTASGVTADLTFNYLDPTDIPMTANEAAFVIFKYNGSFSMPGGTVDTMANTASIAGVTSFSDWTLAEPSAEPCPLSTTPTSQNFTGAAGSNSFTVTADGSCMWDPVSNNAFITIDSVTKPSGGHAGNGTVNYSVSANLGAPRMGTITIGVQTFTVTQDTGCSFMLGSMSQNFTAPGGSSSVSVTATTGCGWTAVSNDAFITVDSGTPGSGNGSVGYTVAANTGPARMGTMTIAGLTFTVTQDAACAFNLSSMSQHFVAAGGMDSVNVITGAGCTWNAASNDAFIMVTMGSSGSGNGTVNYTVAANVGPARMGTMTIAGITFTVTQDGGCTFTLSRDHQSFPGSAGNGSVNVTASDPGCQWTASTSATFIHITSGTPGTGNGTLMYTVDANPGSTIRSDTITVASHTYTVYQGIDFLDVPSNNLFYTEIGILAARGVTLGCTQDHTMYCPNDPVLREQMSAFILRAKGEFSPPDPASQRFTDVPPENVFYNFIDRLAVLGITVGCDPPANTMYCPSSAVTREQMAAFVLRGLGEFSPPDPASQRFTDVPPANVFYNFIDRMAVLNITLGCTPDHLFYCPSDPVTRGQMAAFLVRAFDL
jgi:hypothetical protein